MAPADLPSLPHSPSPVRVSVCFARPGEVFLRDVEVPAGTSIAAAIAASGLLQACPEVDPATMRVGIFSKLKTPDTAVREGDRIEVYRPLLADPKTARRKRVLKTRQGGTREGQKWLRGAVDTPEQGS
ncbi:RnfH family protein [Cupriavidus respiraculi]|uniref:RnfH family protein n=1 Tax=Cupriavidus respiraculi TaxID=195930 RepID=UPI001C93DB98|nr:RnfH family protein [Cupriavidus respiraculi]MBY4946679.1 RnfH family protein [Cupriavidus respiraculi]